MRFARITHVIGEKIANTSEIVERVPSKHMMKIYIDLMT